MAQKVIWHPNMAPSFLLLHVITNKKSLKFTQIGRLLSASRASPQKHVPTTLVGIPVDIYTLLLPAIVVACWHIITLYLQCRTSLLNKSKYIQTLAIFCNYPAFLIIFKMCICLLNVFNVLESFSWNSGEHKCLNVSYLPLFIPIT